MTNSIALKVPFITSSTTLPANSDFIPIISANTIKEVRVYRY
ncbi:hypothetical protein [Niastella populi]|nr:hypothetical protein [Niastella populi]